MGAQNLSMASHHLCSKWNSPGSPPGPVTRPPAPPLWPRPLPHASRHTDLPAGHTPCSFLSRAFIEAVLFALFSSPMDSHRHLRLINNISKTMLFPLVILDISVNSNAIIPVLQAKILASSSTLLFSPYTYTSDNPVSSKSKFL